MPRYNPRLSSIDIEETRRYAGLAASKNFPEQHLLDACIKAQVLIAPQAIWNIYSYDAAFHTIMSPEPLLLTSQSVILRLEGAVEVAVMAATIGEKLEEEVSNEFTKGSYTGGLLLDAAGTAAIEQACDQVTLLIAQHAARFGHITGNRFSPGYGDWDISAQPDILSLAEAGQIGISVTASMMLVPRKSVTAILGIYPYKPSLQIPMMQKDQTMQETTSVQKNDCDNCRQPLCHARKETKLK